MSVLIIIGIILVLYWLGVFRMIGAIFRFIFGIISFELAWTFIKWSIIIGLFMWFGIHFICGA